MHCFEIHWRRSVPLSVATLLDAHKQETTAISATMVPLAATEPCQRTQECHIGCWRARNTAAVASMTGRVKARVGYNQRKLEEARRIWEEPRTRIRGMSVWLHKRFLDVTASAGAYSAACSASFSGFLLSSNAAPAVLHLRSLLALLVAPRRLPGRPSANKFDQALPQRAFF